MADDRSIDTLSLKELGALAVSLDLKHWSRLRKAELVSSVKELLAARQAAEAKSNSPSGKTSKRGRRSSKASKTEVPSESQGSLFELDSPEVQASVPVESAKPKRARKTKSSANATPLLPPESSPVVTPTESDKAESSPKIETSEPPVKKTRRPRKKRDEAVDVSVETKPQEPEVASEVEAPSVEEKSKAPRKSRSKKNASEPVVEKAPATEEEKPVQKKRRGRKANAVEKTPEPVEEPVVSEEKSEPEKKDSEVVESIETPAPKRRRGRARKSEKIAESEEKAASVEPQETTVEEKPAKSSAPKEKIGKKFEEKDLILWNWDDEDDDDKRAKDEEDDDDLDDVPTDDFDDDSDDERESTPEVPPTSEFHTPSKEAIALKERIRRQKIVGAEYDRVDRLALSVCDSYWLRACWEITPQLVERVRSAMGRHWHTADPVLRVFLVDTETKSAATCREHVSDVPIRGGVDNWYIPVDNPPSAFMVELGYRSRDGQFFTLISSNVATTPQRFVHDGFGRSSMGELGSFAPIDVRSSLTGRSTFSAPKRSTYARSTGAQVSSSSTLDQNQNGLSSPISSQPNWAGTVAKLHVDAEVVIKGQAAPGASVSIKDEPIRLRPDGTFSVRYSLPERRHVFPVVTTSADGVEKQTVVLAIDRNTKTLDPVFKEDEEE